MPESPVVGLGRWITFDSGGLALAGYLVEPDETDEHWQATERHRPAILLCHGYPTKGRGAVNSGLSFPQLAERLSTELGWMSLSMNFRGCATSEGDFALDGWVEDVEAAVSYLAKQGATSIWAVGFGTGGSICLLASASEPRIAGVCACGSPAGFDDWAKHPRRLISHSRQVGVISDPAFPPDVPQWVDALSRLRPVDGAKALAPRPAMFLHGTLDDLVPSLDTLELADAHGAAEVRLIDGGGHELRHDPRAIAILTGWLRRQGSAQIAA